MIRYRHLFSLFHFPRFKTVVTKSMANTIEKFPKEYFREFRPGIVP